jgi:transcription elongation factor Elf1
MTFEAWYAEYHKEACDLYGGIDCTDPKGIAQAEVYYDYVDAVIELKSTYRHCQRYVLDEEDYNE